MIPLASDLLPFPGQMRREDHLKSASPPNRLCSFWPLGADQLRPKVPKLAALMDEAESDVLAFMSFPKDHRPKLHSVNPLERLNGEIKRGAHVVGIFPNENVACLSR
jgi:Transposase, Mutator family